MICHKGPRRFLLLVTNKSCGGAAQCWRFDFTSLISPYAFLAQRSAKLRPWHIFEFPDDIRLIFRVFTNAFEFLTD